MKKRILILYLFSFLVFIVPVRGQLEESINKTKKEITELEKKIAEARVNKEDPTTIKMLEDQLVLMKDMFTTLKGLNKDLSKPPVNNDNQVPAPDDNETIIPKRDTRRINMLPDGILTDAQLAVFVKKIHSEMGRLISVKFKTEAERIYAVAKSEKKHPSYLRNIATSLWMAGYSQLAIYNLGKECLSDMNNTNNLNSYAAFLTMSGGEHAAIPILQNLQKKFPRNSTICNNLGQAWFGLGDTTQASKWLDSALKLYPRHSQANLTKSKIQEAQGNKQAAIESMKQSIRENHTTEKESRLVKLGGKLEYDDVQFRVKTKAEPLGLEKFFRAIPEYIMVGGIPAANNEMEWNDFDEKLAAAENNINNTIKVLEPIAELYNIQFLSNPMIIMPYSNTIYRTAKRKLDLLFEWAAYRSVVLDKKMKEAEDSVAKFHQEYRDALGVLTQKARASGAPPGCGGQEVINLATVFNTKANTLWLQRNSELLTFQKQFLNTWANLSLYAATDRSQYDLWIAHIKKSFLGTLRSLHHESTIGCIPEKPKQQFGKALPDFDSLTCQYQDEIFIPPFTTIKTACNRMSTEFNIDTETGLKIKFGLDENLNQGKVEWYDPFTTFEKGTLEIAYEHSLEHNTGIGPAKAELKGQVAAGVEFTRDGIQEVYVKGSASAEAVGYLDEKYIENVWVPESASKGSALASAEVKVSWNAGPKGNDWGWHNSNTSGSASGFCSNINIGGN